MNFAHSHMPFAGMQTQTASAPMAGAMAGGGMPPEFAHAAEATKLFADLLVSENVALREHAIERVLALQERKMAMARLYEDRLQVLIDQPELGKELSPESREDLTGLAKRLQAAAEENARLLKAHIGAVEKVLENIANAVKKAQPKEPHYARNGRMADAAQAERLSFSLNTTI